MRPADVLPLRLRPEPLSVCRLETDVPIPAWVMSRRLWSVTRRDDEFSIVCETAAVPEGVQQETGWRAFEIEGVLDFSLTGILAGLTAALAAAEISVFAVSTYDTDLILVREPTEAAGVLRAAGYVVRGADGSDDMPATAPCWVIVRLRMAPGMEEAFRTYERHALQVVRRYGGQLVAALRPEEDTWDEVHVLKFSSPSAWGAFLADPARESDRLERERVITASEVTVSSVPVDYA